MAELATGEYFFGKMKNNFVELFQHLKNIERFTLLDDYNCSEEFRDFVNCSLIREPKERPNTIELLSHPWILQNLDKLPEDSNWLTKYL